MNVAFDVYFTMCVLITALYDVHMCCQEDELTLLLVVKFLIESIFIGFCPIINLMIAYSIVVEDYHSR